MKHVNSFPTRRTLQPPTAPSDGENTFINTRPESIKYYRERNVQCCRACSRGMHRGLFALNPFPSFFVSHLLLKPEKKRSDIQWSGNFFSIHYSFITHTTHRVCLFVCARYSEKDLSGRLCWKISEKSFFLRTLPSKNYSFEAMWWKKQAHPQNVHNSGRTEPPQPNVRPSPRYQSVSLVSSLPGNCFLR